MQRLIHWTEAFRTQMGPEYDKEERQVQHGQQFVYYKNGQKYVSTNIYASGTILVQGTGTCTDWRDKHFSNMRSFVDKRIQDSVDLSDSATETTPKELGCSFNVTDDTNLKQPVCSPVVQPKLAQTVPNNVPKADHEKTFENEHATIPDFVSEIRNINARLDHITVESNELKEINSELKNQIANLKACLKLEQQTTKSMMEENKILQTRIKYQDDEMQMLKQQLSEQSRNVKPTRQNKSFNIGISSASTPIRTVPERREGHGNTLIHNSVKVQQSQQKRKLKLRSNEKGKVNTLIVGSSITKGIKTRNLQSHVNVNTNRGGTVSSIKTHIGTRSKSIQYSYTAIRR